MSVLPFEHRQTNSTCLGESNMKNILSFMIFTLSILLTLLLILLINISLHGEERSYIDLEKRALIDIEVLNPTTTTTHTTNLTTTIEQQSNYRVFLDSSEDIPVNNTEYEIKGFDGFIFNFILEGTND